MRLIFDRQQMIDQALSGYGRLGNDLYAPFDVGLRQRPAAARAGHRAGQVAAQARPARRGSRSSCSPATTSARWRRPRNLFVEQAKEAGVEVKVTKKNPFYGDDYLSYPFAQDFWNTRNYLPQAAVGRSRPRAAPTTRRTGTTRSSATCIAAAQELDETKRNDLLHDAQEIEYDEGGYIIWGFRQQVDGYARQRPGPRAEQVPAARLLQLQERLGLVDDPGRDPPGSARGGRTSARAVTAARRGRSGSLAGSGWPCSPCGWSRSWSSSPPRRSATRSGRSSAGTTTPTPARREQLEAQLNLDESLVSALLPLARRPAHRRPRHLARQPAAGLASRSPTAW